MSLATNAITMPAIGFRPVALVALLKGCTIHVE
jgi:hypothetical protein